MSKIVKGTVDTIAFGGEGILRHEGLVVFLPFTIPGEKVVAEITQQKSSYARASLLKIETASPHRVFPLCPFFGSCGGCKLQHVAYPYQLETKRLFIQEALHKIGGFNLHVPPITPSSSAPWSYRRHITLHLRLSQTGSLQAGFFGADFLPIDKCPIFTDMQDPILHKVEELLSQIKLPLTPTALEKSFLRIWKKDSRYLLAFSFAKEFSQDQESLFSRSLEHAPPWEGICLKTPLGRRDYGDTKLTVEIEGLHIEYSPYGFMQNHPEQSLFLYQTLLKELPSSTQKVLDLYCGVGISSLLIARKKIAVIGVETEKETLVLAEKNSASNHLTAQFIQAKAEKKAPSLLKSFRPDVVIVNPPRIGLARPLIEALLQYPPQLLIYISCMPPTLARDLKLLTSYQIETCLGFDLFPHTTHVETFVKLRLKK